MQEGFLEKGESVISLKGSASGIAFHSVGANICSPPNRLLCEVLLRARSPKAHGRKAWSPAWHTGKWGRLSEVAPVEGCRLLWGGPEQGLRTSSLPTCFCSLAMR